MPRQCRSSSLSVGYTFGPNERESVGVTTRRVSETPIAVIDFETTGLTPGYDRAVELSIVRIDPSSEPKLVFDSLINPLRPMSCTEIHGITEADVANAPTFNQVAGEVLEACNGCVVASYNVYFDIQFLCSEMTHAGVFHDPPHMCLMYLQPMLKLGKRCKLAEACERHGVPHRPTHIAADDALAAAGLFRVYQREIELRGIGTYADLAALRDYKFTASFVLDPFDAPSKYGLKASGSCLPRSRAASPRESHRNELKSYWELLKLVVADLQVSDDELMAIATERERGGLRPEQIRHLHARAFASAISQFASDEWVDDREVKALRRLHSCLAQLGWAPGQ